MSWWVGMLAKSQSFLCNAMFFANFSYTCFNRFLCPVSALSSVTPYSDPRAISQWQQTAVSGLQSTLFLSNFLKWATRTSKLLSQVQFLDNTEKKTYLYPMQITNFWSKIRDIDLLPCHIKPRASLSIDLSTVPFYMPAKPKAVRPKLFSLPYASKQ